MAVVFCCIQRPDKRRGASKDGHHPVEEEEEVETEHQGITTVDTNNGCEFSGNSDICVSIVTWNMNGRVTNEDFTELVGKMRKYDLLVIGLQESPRKNILRLLNSALSHSHLLLGKAVLQSLGLYIFGAKKSESSVQEVKKDKYEVGGCGGLIRRKKGAVGIKIKYRGITLLFISCHLSAHAHNVDERNSQFRQITDSLFSDKLRQPPPPQMVVWLGDLNYRLQGVDTYPARDLIHNKLHNLLASKDQLLQEAERGMIFEGYNEGTLNFKPTYKYDVGSSNYDTSHKLRAPAWTDRILFKNQDEEHISACLRSYDSVDTIHSSDHKPVKAHLCLKLNK